MKEIEQNQIPGTETLGLIEQIDNFERLSSGYTKHPLGSVFLFDFSNELYTISDWTPQLPQSKGWKNVHNLEYRTEETYPQRYNAFLFVNGDIDNNFSITQTQKDISNETDVPVLSGNVAAYLGESSGGGFNIPVTSDLLKSFRSGYIEFTFKTDKQNCILAVGHSSFTPITSGVNGPSALNAQQNISDSGNMIAIDSNDSYLVDPLVNQITSHIILSDGKLALLYNNKYGNNKYQFSIEGNTNLADNQWHHVVINFNKTGVKRTHAKQFNNKSIEFWVDGLLDQSNDEHINNREIFFPVFNWLWMDPEKINADVPENTEDAGARSLLEKYINDNSVIPTDIDNSYVTVLDLMNYGYYDIGFNNFWSKNLTNAMQDAFVGSMHTYIHGINTPLSVFEIKERLRWWKKNEKPAVNTFDVSCKIVEPIVTTNKKKALKLFWNNLTGANSKNGIELDNNFQIETFSVTHKIKQSSTEIYNADFANRKQVNNLGDVRIVITKNVLLWGPGKELVSNRLPDIFTEQINPLLLSTYDSISFDPTADYSQSYRGLRFTESAYKNLYFSGLDLKSNDRILLTNQFDKRYNGVYVFDSVNNALVRATDSNSPSKINNGIVRVTDGYYKDTTWVLTNNISSLNDNQEWVQIDGNPNEIDFNTYPIFTTRWKTQNGQNRFINIAEDLQLSKYDLIVFMNYPENDEEVKSHFIGYEDFEIKNMYRDFIKSLEYACAQGSSLYVSSPKLAQDLGIISEYHMLDQAKESFDAQSAAISPFESNEPKENYFDTHRINRYKLATEVPGLTDKETYLLTDFINYIPQNINEFEQYHAKYSYRQFGIQEENEFFIPSFALRQISENNKIPGFDTNRRSLKEFAVIEPAHILSGTVVTKLANTYYNGDGIVNNPHDDDATTIIIHNGQLLNGQPITGKIFVNFIEDGYTMSREDYNKATIQTIPENEISETVATRAWQYSTTRLNRLPKKVDIKELTSNGQTTPTNGGGGPLIQAATNSSNGMIRSETDKLNSNTQSDLYPVQREEIYETVEIPVLSMTYLGLQWLAE